ncbi:MAG: DUF1800 domain-containing protein [Planctomycetes bacterium]|nr:DUF1800 domain-containing protein [Planctomycetota bacterium]
MAVAIDPRWAWEPFKPSDKNPWNLQKVGHVYRRAAFGANWNELQTGLELGPDKLIDKMLVGGSGLADFEKETLRWGESIRKVNNAVQAPEWWLYRMLYTPHPLKEKLTLFWHNHFATSNAKVLNVGHMMSQYELMYRHAQGKFSDLLQDMSKDPAMMVWLDTVQSKKGMPNENYARELMELFSLGIGNYTEQDIREAARAFTGWEIKDGKFFNNTAQFDGTEKTFLGKAGKWKGEDIVRLCLEQKACPRFITRKLFRYLISETLDATDNLIDPLAEQFGRGYDFGKLVETMLRSNLFFSEHAYRARIKGPVDFVLGIVHALEARIGVTNLARSLETLGQNVFNPPSVKGWDGGQTWLNGQTLLTRQNLALTLCETRKKEKELDRDSAPLPVLVANRQGKSRDEDLVDFFLNLYLQGDVAAETRKKLVDYSKQAKTQAYPAYWSDQRKAEHRVTSVCHLVLTLPEFQLD